MNKLLTILTFLVSGVIVYLLFTDVSDYTAFQPKTQPSTIPSPTPLTKTWEGYETQKITIEGTEYNLLVADTPEKQETGLMNVTDISPYDGMIFPFNDASVKTFWNKNTLMDLTVLWMLDETVVGKSDLPSITRAGEIVTVTSPQDANIVVELAPKK